MPEFIPFSELLRSGEECRVAQTAAVDTVASAYLGSRGEPGSPLSEAVDELKLARLAFSESYRRAVRRLLQRVMLDVLGRELALAPVDIASIVERALEEFSSQEPVAIRVAPSDAVRVPASLPTRVDSTLSAGDLMIDVSDGVIDARFAVRANGAMRETLAESDSGL